MSSWFPSIFGTDEVPKERPETVANSAQSSMAAQAYDYVSATLWGSDVDQKALAAAQIEAQIRPLLRLLTHAGFQPIRAEINLPQHPDDPLFKQQPITFDIARRETAFFEDWDPDETRDPNWIDLPGAVDRQIGFAIRFRHVKSRDYAAQILWDWDAANAPSGADKFDVTDFRGPTAALTYGPIVPPPSSLPPKFDAFCVQVGTHVAAFVDHYLSLFETAANGFDTTLERPIGPTGMLLDPYHWAHDFRWSEDAAMRRQRIADLEALAKTVWRHYARDAASAKAFLREEILGSPGTDGTDAKPIPARDRIRTAVQMTSSTGFVDQTADRMIGTWIDIVSQPLQQPNSILFQQKERISRPPRKGDLKSWSYTDLVINAIDREVISYQGTNAQVPGWMRRAGFDLKSKLLQDAEVLLAQCELNWSTNRRSSMAGFRALESMLWDIHEVLAGQTTSRFDASHPYPNFFAKIQADYSFSGGLQYPNQLVDTQAKLMAAVNVIQTLHQNSVGEVRDGMDAGTPMEPSNRLVSYEDRAEAWETVASALTAADFFFVNLEYTLAPDALIKAFVEGFIDGLDITSGDKKGNRYKKLIERVHLYQMAYPIFSSAFFAGAAFGVGQEVLKIVGQVVGIVLDPIGFLDTTLKIIEQIRQNPTTETMRAMGKATGEGVKKQADAINARDNILSFSFDLGRAFGPLLLEAIIALFFEPYIVAPLLNRARTGLMTMLRGLPNPPTRAQLTATPPVTRIDAGDGTLIDEFPGADRQTITDVTAMDSHAGMKYDEMPQEVRHAFEQDTHAQTVAALDAIPAENLDTPAPTTPRGPDEPELPPQAYDADVQARKRLLVLSRRQRLENAINALKEPPRPGEPPGPPRLRPRDEYLDSYTQPIPAENQGEFLTNQDIGNLRNSLNHLMDVERASGTAPIDRILDILDPDSDYTVRDKLELLYGLQRARLGLNDPKAFRSIINHWAGQPTNIEILLAIGRYDVHIPPHIWGSITHPSLDTVQMLPAILGTYVRDPIVLNSAMAGLHDLTRAKIVQWHRINDARRFDYATLTDEGIAAFNPDPDFQSRISALSPARKAMAEEAFSRYGVSGWALDPIGPDGKPAYVSMPHPNHPDKPGFMEMWLKRTGPNRSEATQAMQRAVSSPYTDNPDFPGTYHGSHLIPHRWGGPGTADNIVPASEWVNVSTMGYVEKRMDWAMKVHGDVYVRVEVVSYHSNGLPKDCMYTLLARGPDGRPGLVDVFPVELTAKPGFEPLSEMPPGLDLLPTPDGGP